MEMSFRNDYDLIHFLATTEHGQGVLRELVEYRQHLREESTYVLVKSYRDGLVEVYGPSYVQARVVLLGRSVTFPEYELSLEEAVERALPYVYRELHYPSLLRAAALRGLDELITAKEGCYAPSQQKAP